MGRIFSLGYASAALVALATAVPTPINTGNAPNLLLGSSFGVPGQSYTFDYLVIGGGQAGLTMAARLAERQSLLVGVVEAGSFYEITNGNISQVPATDIFYAGKNVTDWQPGIDWGFVTTPQRVNLSDTPLSFSNLINDGLGRPKCFRSLPSW